MLSASICRLHRPNIHLVYMTGGYQSFTQRDHLEDLSVDGNILKWILNRMCECGLDSPGSGPVKKVL
jgi:hypothetical protein